LHTASGIKSDEPWPVLARNKDIVGGGVGHVVEGTASRLAGQLAQSCTCLRIEFDPCLLYASNEAIAQDRRPASGHTPACGRHSLGLVKPLRFGESHARAEGCGPDECVPHGGTIRRDVQAIKVTGPFPGALC